MRLAERHQALVWVSPMSGRNSFPENHRLFAGFLAADRAKINTALAGSDCILVLGAPVFTYHIEGFGPHVPGNAQLFHLTDDPEQAAWCPVGVSVVTNIKAGVAELLDGPAPRRRAAPQPRTSTPPLSGDLFTDCYVLQQVARLRPPGAVIVEEAPSSRGPMHDYLPILDRDGFYTCASGGLGHGLPAAIGVALARPRDKIIAILGDGSSLYSIQGLWSAAQLDLPIAFVILRNGRYQALYEFGHHFGLEATPGVNLPNIDFCGLARSQGVRAIRVEKPEQLDDALQRAFRASKPTLVEVNVDVAAEA